MKPKMGLIQVLWTVFPVILVFACTQAVRITMKMQVPARYPSAMALKEVAVLPFDGPDGKAFSAELEATVASIQVNEKPLFSVVERQKIDQALTETALGQSGLVNENTAAKIGKIVGAKGIYLGVVNASRSNTTNYSESRTRCVAYQNYRCVQEERYSVPCVRSSAVFTFTTKLVEVETSKIVYATSIPGNASSQICEGASQSEIELVESAKHRALFIFKSHIAPSTVTVPDVPLAVSTDGISSDPEKEKFNSGLEFAKGNRMDRACELWESASSQSRNTPSLKYNLGICAEMNGDLKMALQLYEQTDRLLQEPSQGVTASLNRVKKRIQDQKKLEEQTKNL